MKKIWKYFFLLLSTPVTAQNLVPNPSFEDTVACPAGIGDITQALGWSSYKNTPDYLNACNSGQAGVPSNLFGFQNARTGNAYTGLYTFNSAGFYREIIGIQLTQPLIVGVEYFVTFFVCRAVNYDIAVRTGIATNKLGANFSIDSFSFSSPIPINNFCLVYSDSTIWDSLNWVKIAGSFVADSAYNFLSIGNFFVDSAINIQTDSNAVNAYYYVDDICVSTNPEVCEFPVSVSTLTGNSAIRIIPNPAKDWIEIWGSEIQSLVLYDVLGRINYLTYKFISPLKIEVSSFPKGTYILKALTKNNIKTQKIIIQ